MPVHHAPRIVVDFDGVLHSYTSGWQGAETIADPPTEGAQQFVTALLDDGWEVWVCSTRAETPAGVDAIVDWLGDHGFELADDNGTDRGISEVCHGKPPALVYLDDRALRFEGPPWPTLEQLRSAAQPWNKS